VWKSYRKHLLDKDGDPILVRKPVSFDASPGEAGPASAEERFGAFNPSATLDDSRY
jgi:hypothetical protein